MAELRDIVPRVGVSGANGRDWRMCYRGDCATRTVRVHSDPCPRIPQVGAKPNLDAASGKPSVVLAIPLSATNIEWEGIDSGAVTLLAGDDGYSAGFLGVGAAECREKVIIRAHTGES